MLKDDGADYIAAFTLAKFHRRARHATIFAARA